MQIQQCACLLFVSCAVIGSSDISTIAAESSKLEEIRHASFSQVRLIRSIELVMQFKSRIILSDAVIRELPANAEEFPREIVLKGKVSYVESGAKFRIESEILNVNTGEKDTEIAAFNSDRYQLLYKEKKALTTKKTPLSVNPSRTSNPLTTPYVWLLEDGTNPVFSEVKNEKYWKNRFATARYMGERQINGILVDVVEFPYPFEENSLGKTQDAVVQVHFAESLGYYPIASTAQTTNGQVFGEIRISDYKEFLVDTQKVIVPLEFSQTMKVPGEVETAGEFTVLPDTIKLNKDIDEDFFTIPPTWATTVEDADVMDVEKQVLQQERAELLAKARAWRERQKASNLESRDSGVAAIVFTCAIIVFLSTLIYLRRIRG